MRGHPSVVGLDADAVEQLRRLAWRGGSGAGNNVVAAAAEEATSAGVCHNVDLQRQKRRDGHDTGHVEWTTGEQHAQREKHHEQRRENNKMKDKGAYVGHGEPGVAHRFQGSDCKRARATETTGDTTDVQEEAQESTGGCTHTHTHRISQTVEATLNSHTLHIHEQGQSGGRTGLFRHLHPANLAAQPVGC